ncbi:MAG TPA: inositol monophosphatase family protein [Tepidisphaeraceae bacterium]|jgi:myo-inositol-1(or 4)-monophosphatase|nr:inositol monophosphatase family protein [Tepidisphaeraceae bacterium]
MNLSEELQYATELARAAGALVIEQYGKVGRLLKRNNEAVTDADRASQRLIVAGLRRRFAGDGIVGEENDTGDAITFDVPNPAGRNWVIDPIDGTNNFLAGLGIFGVCIGLLDAGRPVLGVVYDVTRDQLFAAAAGLGAWLGAQRLGVSKTPLGDNTMLMLTSNLLGPDGKAPAYARRWLDQTNWKIRMLGSASMEAMQVALGVAHGAVTLNGKLWDIAAPAAVVIEAGGIVTDPRGREIFPFDLTDYRGAKVPYLMAGPAAHPQLVNEMRR